MRILEGDLAPELYMMIPVSIPVHSISGVGQLAKAGGGLGRTGGLSGVLLDGLTLTDESVLAGAGGRGAGEAALDGLADRRGAEVGGEAREEHLALGEHGVRIRCVSITGVLEEW